MSALDEFARVAAERGHDWSVWHFPRLGVTKIVLGVSGEDYEHAYSGVDTEDAASLAIGFFTEGPRRQKFGDRT